MDPLALLCWFATLVGPPSDDAFAVAAVYRPLAGPPQRVWNAGYIYVDGAAGSSGASPGKVRLIRQGQVIEVNLKKIRSHPELDIKLQPGDRLVIPQTMF